MTSGLSARKINKRTGAKGYGVAGRSLTLPVVLGVKVTLMVQLAPFPVATDSPLAIAFDA